MNENIIVIDIIVIVIVIVIVINIISFSITYNYPMKLFLDVLIASFLPADHGQACMEMLFLIDF